MTTARLIIHLDHADDEIVWWAESPDVSGLTAVAPSLAELRALAVEAIKGELGGAVEITEHFLGAEVQTDPSGREVQRSTTQELVA